MENINTLEITDEALGKYYIIEFDSESRERFFYEFLYSLTGRDRDKLLGYKTRTKGSVSSDSAIKKGRYIALRFKNMCKNSGGKINPHEIRLSFNNNVLCRYGSSWVIVDENSKNAVWDAICDGV